MNVTRRDLSLAGALGVDASRLGDQPLSQNTARFPINFARVEAALRESAAASRGWLRNWLPARALVLDVGDHRLRFAGLAEFEFSLAGRTEYPVHRLGELLPMAPVELKRLATNIRQVEKRFADVLAESLDAPDSIGYLFRQLDPKLFSQDHGWRELTLALAQAGDEFNDFKRLALVKYMQYLGARQDVLRSIYLDKKYHREEDGAGFDPLATYAAGLAAPRGTVAPVSGGETLVFDDVTRVFGADESSTQAQSSALPRGETVCVNLGEAGEMPLQLSRQHEFHLCAGRPMRLRAPNGTEFMLADGRNVVGRHAGNEVVVDADYRSVSRRHIVIEPLGTHMALLTDLSAHGSFVPDDRLPEAPRRDSISLP